MLRFSLTILLFFSFALADSEYFERDIDHNALKQCAAWFKDEPDQKMIYLHNGKTMTLKDEFAPSDHTIKDVLYTIKGCFSDENYLIFSQFIPDHELYFLLNMTNATLVPIEGMPYLSPKRETFAVISDIPSIALYTFVKNTVQPITQFFFNDGCWLEKPLWINDHTFRVNLTCNDTTLNQTLSVTATQDQWKLIKTP